MSITDFSFLWRVTSVYFFNDTQREHNKRFVVLVTFLMKPDYEVKYHNNEMSNMNYYCFFFCNIK